MTTVTYYFDGYDAAEAWAINPAKMVDGDISTYAQTNITATQSCNSNTCHGDILGVITKVELRMRIGTAVVKLRPVFSGGDGDLHEEPFWWNLHWTNWFDITTDTNAPTNWTWNDIDTLKCDIHAVYIFYSPRCAKVEVRVTYNTATCGSCNTFSIVGDSHTVELKMPFPNGESNKITKDIQRFNFWSGNYAVHDNGINSQPLVLQGIESASCDKEYIGMCFEGGACFNLYFNMKFTNKFRFIMEMSNDNEEVTITELGDCMNAVYVIKNFTYTTINPRAYSWTMTLEKVR